MPRRTSPGVRSAIDFIVANINSRQFNKSQPLPPIKLLASYAKVSITTMCKATQKLKDLGILEGLPSQRIRVGVDRVDFDDQAQYQESLTGEVPSKEESQYAWKRVREQLRKDILNGVYPTGVPFPSHKEMKNRYNVAFLTLKKSLDSLCTEGMITPCKRTYMVPSLTSEKSRIRIIFFNLVGTRDLFSATGEYIRIFEMECKRAQVNYNVVGYGLKDGGLVFQDSHKTYTKFQDEDDIMGYLIPIKAPGTGWDDVLRQIGHFRKPVAILDDIGGWKLGPLIPSQTAQIFCSRISANPSRKMARFLFDHNHKKIAFISPFHQSAWSRNRLKGFQDVYEAAGLTDSVVPLVFNNPPLIHEFYGEEACERGNYNSITEFYQEWRKGKPLEFLRLMDLHFTKMIPDELLSRGELYLNTRELFDKALADKDITAWVCANDEIALAALDYCEEKKIEVPSQITIVGFDDRYDSIERGLTSYNFNDNAIFHAMLRYLLNRRSFPAKLSRRPIDIDGMIMERLTSGPARKKK